jgi:DNA-binding HxlR family transcriptional regulator
MRSYGQNCALAKALDVVGDRWTLLIVRELLIRGRCRYTDLRNGLPGIATNLLAERLTEMEEADLVTREAAPPPIATTLFQLTDRGKKLEPVIAELGRWGAPLLAETEGDAFCDHWVALPIRLYVRDQAPKSAPARIRLRAGNEVMMLRTTGDGAVQVQTGEAADADATIEGPPRLILALLTGKKGLQEAMNKGVRIEGDKKILRRFGSTLDSKVLT